MFEFVANKLGSLPWCLQFSLPLLVKYKWILINRRLRIKESSSVFRRLLGRIFAQIIILVLACLLLPGETVFPRNFCFVFKSLRDTRLKGKRKGEKKARENAISAREEGKNAIVWPESFLLTRAPCMNARFNSLFCFPFTRLLRA